MRVLIVGGTRFVGYLLTWRLLAAGHQVTLFHRGTQPDPFGARVAHLYGDRTTPDFGRLLGDREWDAVVDMAAYTAADAASAVKALNGRVGHYLFISTGQVYLVRDECAWPAREESYAGPLMPRPQDPHALNDWLYGVHKREAEDVLIRAGVEFDFPATRIRIPMVNGERDYYRRLESYLWRILDGGPVLLPEGGRHPCRHIYALDLVAALADLLDCPEHSGKAYNLCQFEEPTLAELVGKLARLLGAPDRSVPISTERLAGAELRPKDLSPFSDPWMSRLDPTRARRELGFRHRSVDEYLGAIVAHFLAQPPSEPPANYGHRDRERALARGVTG